MASNEAIDDDFCFNPESTSFTLELEEQLRQHAIGNTLYSKRFVLQCLVRLFDAKSAFASHEDDIDALMELTKTSRDVCMFLHSELNGLSMLAGLMDADVDQRRRTAATIIAGEVVLALSQNEVVAEVDSRTKQSLFSASQNFFLVAESTSGLKSCLTLMNVLMPCSRLDEQCIRSNEVIEKLAFCLASSTDIALIENCANFLLILDFDFDFECNLCQALLEAIVQVGASPEVLKPLTRAALKLSWSDQTLRTRLRERLKLANSILNNDEEWKGIWTELTANLVL